jgi:hypothetical protein
MQPVLTVKLASIVHATVDTLGTDHTVKTLTSVRWELMPVTRTTLTASTQKEAIPVCVILVTLETENYAHA